MHKYNYYYDSVFTPSCTPQVTSFSALHFFIFTLKDTCRREGHTYLTEEDVANNFAFRREKQYEGYRVTNFYETLEFLVENKVLHRDCKNSQLRYHLQRYWHAEEVIRRALFKLLTQSKRKQDDIDLEPTLEDDIAFTIDFSAERFRRIAADAKQRLAAEKISVNALTMVSGRGGTGKTELVTSILTYIDEMLQGCKQLSQTTGEESHIINDSNKNEHNEGSLLTSDSSTDETCSFFNSTGEQNECGLPMDQVDNFVEENLRRSDKELCDLESKEKVEGVSSQSNGVILYVAPTGKAAAVMRKRSKKPAFTIHQVLFSFRRWRQKDDQGGEWKFAQTRVCAVDECSMVSLELFASLIKCLQQASRITKIVLLGDVLQLPSIDPGNFMEDMFNAFRPEGFAVELETNHRSEGTLIFENARRYTIYFDWSYKNKGCYLKIRS